MRIRYVSELGESAEGEFLQPDPPIGEAAALCVLTVILICFGLTMLYSTSFGIAKNAFGLAGSSLFVKQLQWLVAGSFVFGGTLLIGYRRLSDWSYYWMAIVALLLIIALFCPAVKGARRWIPIPGVGNIQPSEFAKVVLALFLAKFCTEHSRALEIRPWRFMLFMAGIPTAAIICLVFSGRDMGTSLLLLCIFFGVLFAAGLRLICFVPWILVIPPVLYFFIRFFSPFRWARLTSYMNPEAVADKSGYQLWHSLLALGSGSWTGLGFTESRLKYKYLPEAHTDFILSIVGEELGFLTMCGVLLFYILYIFLACRISAKARTTQGMLLGFGLTTLVAVQAIINVGVISGALPTKGMPAPFISYGGSSLISCITATALIVSIALDAAYPEYHKILARNFRERFRFWRKESRKE